MEDQMPESLPEVVATGDHRASLVALRDHLAMLLDAAMPKEGAPLAKQLSEVMKEIAELPLEKEVSTADAVAAKREQRRRSAAS